MVLTFYNSLTRKKELFKQPKTRPIKLYTCGPTVYKPLHIGNYRTYIFEDIVKRTLIQNGYRVKHVMNITDVGHLVGDGDDGEDKVEREAKKEHRSALDIAHGIEALFKEDIAKLDILPPSIYARATEHIQDQIRLIEKLEKKGYTYQTSDGIYFNTSKFSGYGALAPHSRGTIRAGARVALGEKKHPTDFALWKFSPATGPKRQLEWASPWGTGFPGWHIECSAMAMKYLGPTLDIHAGGIDHAETHHPNEVAQSEAATGKLFALFWMHGAFLTIKGEKMAKSSSETNILISTLEKRGFDPLDFRYLTLGTHYRKPLSFSWEALESARTARLRLLDTYNTLPSRIKNPAIKKKFTENFLTYASDDLNMPKALALLLQVIRKDGSQEIVLWADHILGLDIKKEAAKRRQNETAPKEIEKLLDERERARNAKDWQKADKIREKLIALGWTIKDTPTGPAVHKL